MGKFIWRITLTIEVIWQARLVFAVLLAITLASKIQLAIRESDGYFVTLADKVIWKGTATLPRSATEILDEFVYVCLPTSLTRLRTTSLAVSCWSLAWLCVPTCWPLGLAYKRSAWAVCHTATWTPQTTPLPPVIYLQRGRSNNNLQQYIAVPLIDLMLKLITMQLD